MLYWLWGSNNIELFDINAGGSLKSWKPPVNGPDRRAFADKVKLTAPVPYTSPMPIPIGYGNFATFAKQIQQMGTTYITCADTDKVAVMQDIIDRLHSWATANVTIDSDGTYYLIGILLTLSKIQTDPQMPPVVLKLSDIYGWIKSNLQDHLNDGTHAACAYLLMGIMLNDPSTINQALGAWKNIFQNVIPGLANDLSNANKFMDVAYVLNDTMLVLYIFYVNNVNLLDDNEMATFHSVVNQYAQVTLEHHDYLTAIYGNKDPAHTLSWIVLYNRMWQWTKVDEKNLSFFTDNLSAMLTYREAGYGGSTFWNFAV